MRINRRLATLAIFGGGLLWQACGRAPAISPDAWEVSVFRPDLREKPEPAWEVKLPAAPTYVIPLGRDALLVATHRGQLFKLDLKTGKRKSRIWHPFKAAITAQLLREDRPVLYAAVSRDGKLIAYDLGRRKILWKRKDVRADDRMVLLDSLLLLAGTTGEVSAYHATEGQALWRRQLPKRIFRGVWLQGGHMLVLDDGGNLYAFEPHQAGAGGDSTLFDYPYLWRRALPVNPAAVVALGDGQTYLADSDGQLVKINAASGDIIYTKALGGPIYGRPAVADSLVVVAVATGVAVALRAEDGRELWRTPGRGLVKHGPLVAGGGARPVVVIPFARGQLLALDLATGEELWRHDTGAPLDLIILTAEGIVVAHPNNRLVYLRAAEGERP